MVGALNVLWKLLTGQVKTGTVFISSTMDLVVRTGFTPSKVYLNFDQHRASGACGSSLDCFDVRIVPKGFIIFCKVHGNYRRVTWIAIK